MHGFYAVPVESNKAEQSLIMTWRACAIRISRFFRWYAERSHEGCASRKSSNNWWFWSSNAAPVCVMFRLLWPTHGLVLETWRAIGIWYLQMWLSKPDVTFLNCSPCHGEDTWLYSARCDLATGRLKGFSFSLLPPTKGIGISLVDPSSLQLKKPNGAESVPQTPDLALDSWMPQPEEKGIGCSGLSLHVLWV